MLSQLREKELNEELLAERENALAEMKANSCLNCESRLDLKKKEKEFVCTACRNDVDQWKDFLKKVKKKQGQKKHIKAQIKMVKALKMNNPLWDVE